jgi:hypothetical protein
MAVSPGGRRSDQRKDSQGGGGGLDAGCGGLGTDTLRREGGAGVSWAARIVVRVDKDGVAHAGFASQIRGREIYDGGKWAGCQMSYKPFERAMDKARELAREYNADAAKAGDLC